MEIGRADVNQVLQQMRSMKADMQQMKEGTPLPGIQGTPLPGIQSTQPTGAPSFGNLLENAVNSVNDLQKTSGDLQRRFEMGDPGTTLPEVMIAMQKSSVAFTAMTEVRNKLVTAYEDIMKMPI